MKAPTVLLASLVILSPPAAGSEPAASTLGTFKDWSAARYSDGDGRHCYLVSRPVDSAPKNVTRGDVYIMVTRQPRSGAEVSLRIGYPFKDGTSARITIDAETFELATADKYAWPSGAADTRRLMAAMRKGREMTIEGVSRRGTRTSDRFSLLGFAAAHRAVLDACR
jgi:hypothetical protein